MHPRTPALQEDVYLGVALLEHPRLKISTGKPFHAGRCKCLVQVQRSGDEAAAVLDYDIQNERVTLTAEQACRSALP